ncbi:Endosulfine-domain-containing protein [Jimgerdemannia flammicorona]|uniref:mRNA stability protein n=1 Tax=Jimgerdemannia flammicorona TaxID=994334 RepID=A0A433PKN8_9FUNG|nr:Endosulfine-domain-containing protein [Jimgerdemannia flammicorona]
MLPAKKNKIDITAGPQDVLANKLKERKYFDSGDYALSKAGKADSVGSQHPSPENIPHSNPTTKDNASPTKESSLVHDTTENLGSTPAVVAVKPAEEVVAAGLESS